MIPVASTKIVLEERTREKAITNQIYLGKCVTKWIMSYCMMLNFNFDGLGILINACKYKAKPVFQTFIVPPS